MTEEVAVEHELPFVEGFTIDGPQSRDLDDAIWLEMRRKQFFLRVCIADVASTVTLNSSLDLRARARGFTRYFAETNAPMLPRALSEDQLSLLPQAPRRVICIEMLLDHALDCAHIAMRPAILQSAARLTYAQAAVLSQGMPVSECPEAIVPLLPALAQLSRRLLEKRRARGELVLYDLRSGLTMNEEGQLKRLNVAEANLGYVIIQELMLLTNRSVAEYLLQLNLPTLFRNHEASVAVPERSDLVHRVENALAHPTHFDLGTLQKNLQLVLCRARYSPQVTGHFGLNLPAYLHFTSPIRRYADLVNQRIVIAHLDQKSPPYAVEELKTIGDELNTLVDEHAAKRAESYKRRKAAEIERTLAAAPQQIAALPDKDVYRVVLRAAQEPEPAKTLVAGLQQRLSANKMSLKEAFAILYESPVDSEAWKEIRRQTLLWLRQHPQNAISLLAIGEGLKNWSPAKYTYTGSGAYFSCTAVVCAGDTIYRSEPWYGSSKRRAQQQAALVACHLLCNAELPQQRASPPPKEPANTLDLLTMAVKSPGEACKTSPQASSELLPTSLPDLKHFDWSLLEQNMQTDNYVGALYTLCQKTQRKQPRFHLSPLHGDKENCLCCQLTLAWKEGIIQLSANGKNKQDAKQNASQVALNVVRRVCNDG